MGKLLRLAEYRESGVGDVGDKNYIYFTDYLNLRWLALLVL